MLRALSRKLTTLVITVFVSVSLIFAAIVYLWFEGQLNRENHEHLRIFSQTLSASIEAPEIEAREHNGKEAIPDVLEQHESPDVQPNIGIQWFDENGKKLVTRGGLEINLPFSATATFEIQTAPHALSLTKVVERNKKTAGYLRTGISLANSDTTLSNLRAGLAVGLFASFFIAAAATWLIVRQALKPAQEGFEKLSQFTADASHELKTPITAIKMNSDVLTRYSKLSAEDSVLVKAIADAAEQMNNTVQDLLMLSQNDSTSASISESIDLPETLREVIQDLHFAAAEKSIDLLNESASNSAKITVNTSSPELRRLISNLVQNAIQYSNNNGKIIVACRAKERFAEITVQDFGVGIAPSDQQKIFDRFWRADQARESASGNGLGLAIAQSIAEKHGGKIDVQSTVGKGSTFTLTLPLS